MIILAGWEALLGPALEPRAHNPIVLGPDRIGRRHALERTDIDLAELLDDRGRPADRRPNDLGRLDCAPERRGIDRIDRVIAKKRAGLLRLQHTFRRQRVIDGTVRELAGEVGEIFTVANQVDRIHGFSWLLLGGWPRGVDHTTFVVLWCSWPTRPRTLRRVPPRRMRGLRGPEPRDRGRRRPLHPARSARYALRPSPPPCRPSRSLWFFKCERD